MGALQVEFWDLFTVLTSLCGRMENKREVWILKRGHCVGMYVCMCV